MNIQPQAMIAAIPADDIVLSTSKLWRLPGGNPAPKNLLSGKQLNTIVLYLQANTKVGTTWASGIAQLRTLAGVTNGWDFPIVDYCLHSLRKAIAANELTFRQENLVDSCMQALSGVSLHFDLAISTKIRDTEPEVVALVLRTFMFAETNGGLNRAMRMFSNVFGRLPNRVPDDISELDETTAMPDGSEATMPDASETMEVSDPTPAPTKKALAALAAAVEADKIF